MFEYKCEHPDCDQIVTISDLFVCNMCKRKLCPAHVINDCTEINEEPVPYCKRCLDVINSYTPEFDAIKNDFYNARDAFIAAIHRRCTTK